MNREQAIEQLRKSSRGVRSLRAILDWLDADGIGLDEFNQNAVITLIGYAWRQPGSTRDLMRDALYRLRVDKFIEKGKRDGMV